MEKASFEKIRRLLEVSEWERHYKVLLTSKNLADMRRNPACYNLPIIQRPLPSKVIDGEHFVTVDMLRLIFGSASTSGGAHQHLPLIVGVLGQLNLHLDGVKGVAHPNAFVYLVGEANLPPEY